MSNTLYIATSDMPVVLSWEGAEPRDAGPAGTVVRMLIAQMAGHRAATCDEVTACSWDMVKVGPLGKVVRLVCKTARFDGECSATLPTTIWYDDNVQELAFVLRVERGRWKIDMMATIERAMGGILDEAAAAVVAVAR
jgi:hypothetical protein